MKKGPPGPTPRIADGHVDLSGVWGYAGYTSDIAKDYDVGELPMTPFGEKLFKERQANEGTEDPEARCLPTGVPRRDPYPSKILQLPNLVVILYEGNLHSFRQIFLNRDHPKDLNPTWWGDSVGKWEGDELVVDTIGFNGLTWLDLAGPRNVGSAPCDRTLLAAGLRQSEGRDHHRGSGVLHAPLEGHRVDSSDHRQRSVGVHLHRERARFQASGQPDPGGTRSQGESGEEVTRIRLG